MKTRALKDSDIEKLRMVYDESELQDGWPDFSTARCEVVVDEYDQPLACAGVRLVPEAFLIVGRGNPAARLHWIRMLQGKLLEYLNETGYKRVIALVAPKIERAFLRRLGSFGWKAGCQSAIFLAEESDVNRVRR